MGDESNVKRSSRSDVEACIDFLLEMEKLKNVLRKTRPHGLSRLENSAEHSWQTTLAALLFMPEGLDALKVLKILLIHDIVEIDAGDVFVYDDKGRADVAEVEHAAAVRLFAMLPEPQSAQLMALWEEFESRRTPEARYAKAMDRVCPVIQNLNASVSSWTEHDISRQQVLEKNREIENANPELWAHLKNEIDRAPLREE